MKSPSRTVYQYIIKKNKDKPPQMWSEQIIHSGWCVGEAESHDQKFVVSKMCTKCSFVYVVDRHSDLVVP